jgi:hypothetical protein
MLACAMAPHLMVAVDHEELDYSTERGCRFVSTFLT